MYLSGKVAGICISRENTARQRIPRGFTWHFNEATGPLHTLNFKLCFHTDAVPLFYCYEEFL